MDEEKDLIRRLRLGEPAALHGIYQRYKDDLLTVACCLTGDRAGGEDVLHDVFVALAAKPSGEWRETYAIDPVSKRVSVFEKYRIKEGGYERVSRFTYDYPEEVDAAVFVLSPPADVVRIVSVGAPTPHPDPRTEFLVVPCEVEIETRGATQVKPFTLNIRHAYNQPDRFVVGGGF